MNHALRGNISISIEFFENVQTAKIASISARFENNGDDSVGIETGGATETAFTRRFEIIDFGVEAVGASF